MGGGGVGSGEGYSLLSCSKEGGVRAVGGGALAHTRDPIIPVRLVRL